MYESYASIQRQSREALITSLCSLIRQARLILIHPDMQNDAKLTAVEHLLNEYAPPPSPSGTGLFTDAAAAVTGEEVTIRIMASDPVPASNYPELLPGLSGEDTAIRREGMLVTTSGQPVAEVTSAYLPRRMPQTALALLRAGIPLGRALAPAVRREPLPSRDGRSRGLLWVPDGRAGEWPAAVASELLLL